MWTFLAVGCRRALAMIPGSNAGGGRAADVVTDCVVGCAREAEDGCGTSMGTDKTTSVGEFFWFEDNECAPPANSIIACACKHRNRHTQILDMWKSPTIPHGSGEETWRICYHSTHLLKRNFIIYINHACIKDGELCSGVLQADSRCVGRFAACNKKKIPSEWLYLWSSRPETFNHV